MNELEKMVWAAAFAAEFAKERAFYQTAAAIRAGKGIDDIHGYGCAEIADVAVDKLREAFTCESADYLYPVKEGLVYCDEI